MKVNNYNKTVIKSIINKNITIYNLNFTKQFIIYNLQNLRITLLRRKKMVISDNFVAEYRSNCLSL